MSKEIIIIGNMENDRPLSGPATVVATLMDGLDKKGVKYRFINSYAKTPIKKIKLFINLALLIFKRHCIVNVHTFGYKSAEMVMKISRINKSNRYFLTLNGLLSKEIELYSDKKYECNEERPEYSLIKNFPDIICVSEWLRKKIEKEYGRSEGLYVVNNCIRQVNTSYSFSDTHNILMAGGICPEKGTMEALEIFNDIYYRLWNDSTLTVVGVVSDQSYHISLLNYMHDRNLQERVKILGRIEKKELIKLYRHSDFIIASSLIDTFNLTVLEAMNYGCVPIVSSNCGVKDLISGDMGVVYEKPDDVCDMLNALNIHEASEKSFEVSCSYDAEHMAGDYLRVFYGEC